MYALPPTWNKFSKLLVCIYVVIIFIIITTYFFLSFFPFHFFFLNYPFSSLKRSILLFYYLKSEFKLKGKKSKRRKDTEQKEALLKSKEQKEKIK